jgi:hypothetical protein
MRRFEHAIAANDLVWKARRDVMNQLAEVQQSKRPRVDLALPSFWLKAAAVHEGLARLDAEVEAQVEQHDIDAARAVEAALQGPQPARAGRAVRRELGKLRPKPGPPLEPTPGSCEFCGRPRGACAVVPCATARLHGGGLE